MRLATGDEAPAFTRPDKDNQTQSLADFSGKGLVIYFYPKAFTPGCTTESCDFRASRRFDPIPAPSRAGGR